MAALMKPLRVLRNNWKKSTFATVLLIWGSKALKERLDTSEFMREYAIEARKYGDVSIPVSGKLRQVTVILNPLSKHGKSEKQFEKYAAPLLHLAGIKVSMILTEYPKQAQQLMEIMNNTDAVIIAGGDGTIHEAVCGLLNREDATKAVKLYPLALCPVGKSNFVAKNLLGLSESYSDARLMAESTMALIRESIKPTSVMKIQSSSEDVDIKAVHSLGSLELGLESEAKDRIHKYWYWGVLRKKAAYFFTAFKEWGKDYAAVVDYTAPCEGCSNCYKAVRDETDAAVATGKGRWWSTFIPRSKPTPALPLVDLSKRDNPRCSERTTQDLSFINFSIRVNKAEPIGGINSLEFSSLPVDTGMGQFVQLSWSKTEDRTTSEPINAREIKVDPKFEEGEEKPSFFVDGERYKAQPVIVNLLPIKLQIYTPSFS